MQHHFRSSPEQFALGHLTVTCEALANYTTPTCFAQSACALDEFDPVPHDVVDSGLQQYSKSVSLICVHASINWPK